MTNSNPNLKPFLEDNFVIYQKNGTIGMKKIPPFGSLIFTSQDNQIVQVEVRQKEKI